MVRKAVSFALVGVVNASVDFSIYSLLRFYFGFPILLANVCSWTVAVSGSYVMNSKFTFGHQLGFKRYGVFVVSQIGGLVANTVTVFVLYHLLRPEGGVVGARLTDQVAEMVAKVLAIGVTFLVNFSLSHFVVFRPRPAGDDAR